MAPLCDYGQKAEKSLPVAIRQKNYLPGMVACGHMIHSTGTLYAQGAGHSLGNFADGLLYFKT